MARSLIHISEEHTKLPKALTDLSIVLVGDSTQLLNVDINQQTPHLLGIAQEIRDKIYQYMRDDIHKNRAVAWNYNIRTEYDGIRLACWQLFRETFRRVFYYQVPRSYPSKLINWPIHKTMFQDLRMLTIEVDHNAGFQIYNGFCIVLNRLQVTVQELHILFVGKDGNGVETKVHGCGNITGRDDEFSRHQEPLLISGQDVSPIRFNLYRQLSLMRELRVLRVRNANFPLTTGALLRNKPHLQALSVVNDPRTVLRNYRTLPRQSWMQVNHDLTAVKALEFTANAIKPSSGTVKRLARGLEHLTWIIPRFDYQRQAGAQIDYSFYAEVGSLVQFLSVQAPHLTVLRLCIGMREVDWQDADGVNGMAEEFRRCLPRFPRLEHFEIHCSGGTQFFRDSLIAYLPASLKRLYITDSALAPRQLHQQVWRKYFQPLALRNQEGTQRPGSPISGGRRMIDGNRKSESSFKLPSNDGIFITVSESGFVSYSTNEEMQQSSGSHSNMLICHRKLTLEEDNDCLVEAGQFCKERKFRGEAIPLNTAGAGSLGCITYEYDCREGGEEDGFRLAPDDEWESDTTTMLRLNGKLLDRERHLHLRYEPSNLTIEGIPPPRMRAAEGYTQGQEAMPETARYSRYANIYAAIYNAQDFKPQPAVVEENNKALSKCLGEDWYFGSEDEAMKVFELEPSAKIESQRPRSTLDVVDCCRDGRCRWLSPDYEVSPVGDVSVPIVPRDWKSRPRS